MPEFEFDEEPLTEAQEESLHMVHQAILESAEMEVPGEVLLFSLLQVAAEFAINEGFTKKEFLQGAGLLFEESLNMSLIEHASEMKALEE